MNTIESLTAELAALRAERDQAMKYLQAPSLKRNQPCGCIVCYCEDDERCHGCGARSCATDDCVFKDGWRAREYEDAPSYPQLVVANDSLRDRAERAESDAAESKRRCGELTVELSKLAGYARTVRLDRLDRTKEHALQTVDWCEGLMEYANRAAAALTPEASK